MKEEEIEYLKQQRAYGHKFNNRQIISITNVALKLIKTQKAETENKNKIINLMAEQLTTPINDKKWVIEYYTKLVEEEK